MVVMMRPKPINVIALLIISGIFNKFPAISKLGKSTSTLLVHVQNELKYLYGRDYKDNAH